MKPLNLIAADHMIKASANWKMKAALMAGLGGAGIYGANRLLKRFAQWTPEDMTGGGDSHIGTIPGGGIPTPNYLEGREEPRRPGQPRPYVPPPEG